MLGLATITGTALATYVITGGTKNKELTTGKPTEVLIENKVLNLEASFKGGLNTLSFEPTDADTEGRVTSTGGGNMTLTLVLKVVVENLDYLKSIKITTAVNQTTTDIETYVNTPDILTLSPESNSKWADGVWTEQAEGEFIKEVTLEWTWNETTFDGVAPCLYYDGAGSSVEIDDVVTTMDAFKTAVANVSSYTINIEAEN